MPSVAPILHPYGIIIRLIMQIVPFYNLSEIPPNNSIFVSITAALSHTANRFWAIYVGNRLIISLLFSSLPSTTGNDRSGQKKSFGCLPEVNFNAALELNQTAPELNRTVFKLNRSAPKLKYYALKLNKTALLLNDYY